MATNKGTNAEYRECQGILRCAQSTTDDKIAAFKNLQSLFPKRLCRHVPELFTVITSNVACDLAESELRIAAVETICAMIRSHSRGDMKFYLHDLLGSGIRKGALDALHQAISKSTNAKLIEACIECLQQLLQRECIACRNVVLGHPNVLEAFSNKLALIPLNTVRSLVAALDSAKSHIRGTYLCPAYLNVFAKVVAHCGQDDDILKNSLSIVVLLEPSINTLLDEDGLISRSLDALSTKRNHSIESLALQLIEHVMNGTDAQIENVCMRAGFVRTITPYLASPDRTQKRNAVYIFNSIAAGLPHQVDLLLTDHTPIPGLLQIMRDGRESWDIQYMIESMLLSMLESLAATPRPAHLQFLLGEGVVSALVRRGCGYVRYNYAFRRMNEIKQALITVLQTHPEFWRAVELVQGPARFMVVPARRRREAVDYIFEDEDVMDI